MNPDVHEKWQKARQLAKNSSGGGVDAANIMLAQLNAQKPIKKKTSQEMPAPTPEAAVETGPMEAQLVTLGLRNEERLTTAEVLKAYKKKILLHASGKGGGKIENYTNAYVQIMNFIRKNASDDGNEEVVQKCNSLLPGDIRVSSNVLILKVEQTGRVWKRVIKQKHPGAISLQSKNGESQASSKFSTTWRPSGDYIHLKVTFLVQKNSIQVGGSSYLLWAIENFEEFSDLATKLSKVEHEEKINDSEKLTFIFKGLKYMKDNCDDFIVKLNKIESEQEAEKRDHVTQGEKIEELYSDLHDIRQVCGARCLSDGHSAHALIYIMNKEAVANKETGEASKKEEEESIADDVARKDSFHASRADEKKTETKKKAKSISPNRKYRRKITQAELNKTNRLESIEDDSGFKSVNS